MFKKSGLLTFYAETSLHMGSGTSLSYVDLLVIMKTNLRPIEQEVAIRKAISRKFPQIQDISLLQNIE